MKHFFHIHSNINLIVAIALIEKKKLPKEDVVFFIARNIQTDYPGIKKVFISDEIYYTPFAKKRLALTLANDLRIIKMIDKMIKENCEKDDFTYYVPHSRNALYTIFLTHIHCVQVHYIEDGMDNYLSVDGLEKKFPHKVPKGHRLLDRFYGQFWFYKFDRLRSYDDIYRSIGRNESTLFGIGKNSYQNQANRGKKIEILDVAEVPFFDQFTVSDEAVFVFDAVEEQKVVPGEILDKLLHWFGRHYSDIQSIAIKFHPFQSNKNRARIIGIFEQYMEVSTLADSLLLECAFAKAKGLKVFGIGSSLLNYAYELNSTNSVEILYPYFLDEEQYESSRLPIWEDCFRDNTRISLAGRDFKYST